MNFLRLLVHELSFVLYVEKWILEINTFTVFFITLTIKACILIFWLLHIQAVKKYETKNRRHKEIVWDDELGFMWSWWLFNRYETLHMKESRTPEEEAEIDMIVEASKKGRKALEEIEDFLKNK